jgi:predicted nucleotidyltransferase component of viral defense system
LLDTPYREIFHPYSDTLGDHTTVACYSIAEIVSEKLRALKQRSYTAPRDFYDLYYLSKQLRKEDWEIIVPTFLKKMAHKGLEFHSFKDLIDDGKISNVKRAWKTSIAHQIQPDMNAEKIIDGVVQLIKRHLPNGQ